MYTAPNSTTTNAEAVDAAWRGIEMCRDGDWEEGFYWLSRAAEAQLDTAAMPSQFFACLGYSLAMQNKLEQGLRLCRKAVELDFYQPENYLFLSRVQVLTGDRRSALEAIERGLQCDPEHRELRAMRRDLGQRRSPVLPFLSRAHILNRGLGQIRHRLLGGPKLGRRSRDSG